MTSDLRILSFLPELSTLRNFLLQIFLLEFEIFHFFFGISGTQRLYMCVIVSVCVCEVGTQRARRKARDEEENVFKDSLD